MEGFCRKYEPCINSFKRLSKDIAELIWLLFAGYQWIMVFAVSISVFFWLIIRPFTSNKESSLSAYSFYSTKAIIYSVVAGFIYVVFSCYYVFYMRKKPELSIRNKVIVLSLYVVVFLLFTYKIELTEYEYILKNIKHSTTTIQIYDEDGMKLNSTFSWQRLSDRSHPILPIKNTDGLYPDGGIVIELIDVQPVEYQFSAKGYKPQKVLIGSEEGEKKISIHLEKEALSDPNSIAD